MTTMYILSVTQDYIQRQIAQRPLSQLQTIQLCDTDAIVQSGQVWESMAWITADRSSLYIIRSAPCAAYNKFLFGEGDKRTTRLCTDGTTTCDTACSTRQTRSVMLVLEDAIWSTISRSCLRVYLLKVPMLIYGRTQTQSRSLRTTAFRSTEYSPVLIVLALGYFVLAHNEGKVLRNLSWVF